MENLLINRMDFSGVVNISEHGREGDEILEQFILERQNLDLIGLLGNGLYNDILENKDEVSYQDLMNGGVYEVNGLKRRHFGIKRVLIHYAYAAYVYRGGMVDTPFSVVQKQSQDSIPVPISELRALHDENRKMAYKYWLMTHDYLCNHSDQFTYFDDCECNKCDNCEDKNCNVCKGGKPDRTRGYRLKVIRKNG